jgi:hemin uptake protein HemP
MTDAFVAQNPFEPPATVAATEQPFVVDSVVIDSASLLKGAREVLIQHGGECYRLRHTRNDKLIMTK